MAKKKTPRSTRRKEVCYIAGEVFEANRVSVTRCKGFPKAFYAFSLSHGHARLDGADPVGELMGESGARIRVRVTELWQKQGGVVVEHDGVMKLAWIQ